jgi:branched-chain amino acid transport system substrate-binding protein
MGALRRIAATSAALLVALALAGCLGDGERPSRVEGDTAVVYSSLPRAGVSASAARAAAAGQRLALADAGGRAGGLRVRLVELDAGGSAEEPWSPERIDANAERAADDPRAIAYLGELAYGASAVSLPITNEAGLLQVSPDTLTSLTRTPLGRPRAGPERYYPSGARSFERLVPHDGRLAELLLALARRSGARRMAVLFEGDIYSRELGAQLVALGRRDGPEPVSAVEYRGRVEEIPDVARELAEAGADAVVWAGIAGPGTARMLAQIDALQPGVPVYGGAGLLSLDPTTPIPSAPATVLAAGPLVPPGRIPADGRRLLARLRRAEGRAAARPEALYGYESMRVVLDALRAGGADRARVRRAALGARARSGSLGDVDSGRFSLWALREGRFVFVRMVG